MHKKYINKKYPKEERAGIKELNINKEIRTSLHSIYGIGWHKSIFTNINKRYIKVYIFF